MVKKPIKFIKINVITKIKIKNIFAVNYLLKYSKNCLDPAFRVDVLHLLNIFISWNYLIKFDTKFHQLFPPLWNWLKKRLFTNRDAKFHQNWCITLTVKAWQTNKLTNDFIILLDPRHFAPKMYSMHFKVRFLNKI